MKKLYPILTVVTVASPLIWYALTQRSVAEAQSKCAIIHRPPKGCPLGFVEIPELFLREGVRSSGCVALTRDKVDCVDVLYPGEGVRLDVLAKFPEEL